MSRLLMQIPVVFYFCIQYLILVCSRFQGESSDQRNACQKSHQDSEKERASPREEGRR